MTERPTDKNHQGFAHVWFEEDEHSYGALAASQSAIKLLIRSIYVLFPDSVAAVWSYLGHLKPTGPIRIGKLEGQLVEKELIGCVIALTIILTGVVIHHPLRGNGKSGN